MLFRKYFTEQWFYLKDYHSDGEAALEVSLDPLYKQDKKGRWSTLLFRLSMKPEAVSIVTLISKEGTKSRVFTRPIKRVASKEYNTVIEERLLSAWNKKRDREGWLLSKEEKPKRAPMLLHHYTDKTKDNIKYPCIVMPKLNGIRCIYDPDSKELLSRKHLPFDIPHLKKELDEIGVALDGELWHPKWSLEEIVSAVRGKKEDREELQFIVFNTPGDDPFDERLCQVIPSVYKLASHSKVRIIRTYIAWDERVMLADCEVLTKEKGNDGAVIANVDHKYLWDTRSYEVLKYKSLISEEFILVGMDYDEDAIGLLAKPIFRDKDGVYEFSYVPNMTKESRRDWYQEYEERPEEYRGSLYTLEFREYTKYGKPKHITNMIRRDYE